MARTDLYQLLVRIATQSDPRISYSEVSRDLPDHPDPKSGLTTPLCELNCECKKADLPPISAVVVQRDENGQLGIPGVGFWNCPAVAPKPKGGMDQIKTWIGFLKQIQQTNWPERIPGLS